MQSIRELDVVDRLPSRNRNIIEQNAPFLSAYGMWSGRIDFLIRSEVIALGTVVIHGSRLLFTATVTSRALTRNEIGRFSSYVSS